MSKHIRHVFAVTEHGVVLTPCETVAAKPTDEVTFAAKRHYIVILSLSKDLGFKGA